MKADVASPVGRVAFVGAGPGDPGLLTIRGQRILAEAQVVVFGAGVARALLDSVPEAAERIRVGEDAGGVPQATVPALLAARATSGLRVARLLDGDAGDFGAEATTLAARGVSFDVVPGVSGIVAGLLYAGIPLSAGLGSVTVAVLDATDPTVIDWGRLGRAADPLLVRVNASSVAAILAGLLDHGRPPETPAALISEVASFRQRTVTASLSALGAEAGLGDQGEALLVVGRSVELRQRLAWLERRPLYGRRVLVTRPRAQAARFAALLEDCGASVVALPTIRLEPPDDWGPLDRAIDGLAAFRWVVFTSASGVAAFRERLGRAGRDARAVAGARLAVIGPETAEALRRVGLEPDLVPVEYRAEGLLEALRPHVEAGDALLLVRAAEAREVLPRGLQALDIRVTVAPAYRTVTAKDGADDVVGLLEARGIDVITFTSSSTVRGLMALLAPEEIRRALAGVVLAAIGPVTAATIAEYGLAVGVMPREYTVSALAAAIAAHFARPE